MVIKIRLLIKYRIFFFLVISGIIFVVAVGLIFFSFIDKSDGFWYAQKITNYFNLKLTAASLEFLKIVRRENVVHHYNLFFASKPFNFWVLRHYVYVLVVCIDNKCRPLMFINFVNTFCIIISLKNSI